VFTLKKYLASYHHDGANWSFIFYALDMEDAKNRFEKIKAFGRLDGEITLKINTSKIKIVQKITEKIINSYIYVKRLLFQN
jgi:hypothetical protein